jgi:predicted  nucleic acid-binding Zn-ribbon protein
MIQNEHQYKVTKGEIDKLQQVIDKLLEQPNIPPSQLAEMQNGFQTQIDRMQMEIQAYDDRKAGKVEITMGAPNRRSAQGLNSKTDQLGDDSKGASRQAGDQGTNGAKV